jgi:anti-sigma B factor antagonist
VGPLFEVSEAREGDRIVLAVSGEIDMATADQLRDALLRAAESRIDVWVDLSEVEFMDSTGLNALVIAHRAMGDDGRRLYVICPDGPAHRALEVSGLHEVLHVSDGR